MNTIETILVGIMISAVTSLITVQLSLHRFRKEKWWEKRVEAYERVIEALHHSKAFSDVHLEAIHEGGNVSDERKEELRIAAKDASCEIERAVDLGTFFLGDAAHGRLRQYQKDAKKAYAAQDWYAHLERDWVATKSCLEDIIEIAQRDLKR